MLADIDEDPDMWKDVKVELNDMIGKVDMSQVLISAFQLAYGQIEIARLASLESERADKQVESACVAALEAERERRWTKGPAGRPARRRSR